MDTSEWFVYGIVALAALYLLFSFCRKKKKGCCSKGCPPSEPSKERDN